MQASIQALTEELQKLRREERLKRWMTTLVLAVLVAVLFTIVMFQIGDLNDLGGQNRRTLDIVESATNPQGEIAKRSAEAQRQRMRTIIETINCHTDFALGRRATDCAAPS